MIPGYPFAWRNFSFKLSFTTCTTKLLNVTYFLFVEIVYWYMLLAHLLPYVKATTGKVITLSTVRVEIINKSCYILVFSGHGYFPNW